jgi:hypothetical protein
MVQGGDPGGPEVIDQVVRLDAVSQDQQPDPQGRGHGQRGEQRGTPVAALGDEHQRDTDREQHQRGQTPMRGECGVSHEISGGSPVTGRS